MEGSVSTCYHFHINIEIGFWRWNIHNAETKPLHADLSNAQQAGKTLERRDGLATSDISTGSWQDKNICEATRAGCDAQEDEVGRDAFGALASDDSVVLGEIGD